MSMWLERDIYMNRLRALKHTPEIKVITGLRRSGKSVLMRQFADEIKRNEPEANILYIDLLDLENSELLDFMTLHKYIVGAQVDNASNYLFIDEVQLCDGFERTINSIYSRGSWDMYITGSNAFLLSSDLATLFTGRQMEVHVLPFSFHEYRSYLQTGQLIDKDFDDYVKTGGLAGTYHFANESDVYMYIREVFTTIIKRDLEEKYTIRDTDVIIKLATYLLDNVGNLNSTLNIANTLKAHGIETNHVTVRKYLSYLRDAFLFYETKRYDIKGRQYLSSQEKYYTADIGFRRALLGRRNMDWGHLYENLVYLELLRRGYDVYVGKLYNKEIDFVALKDSELMYIQVSDSIAEKNTLERELQPLLSIKDGYSKVLIVRTFQEQYTVEGIQVLDLARWLDGEQEITVVS